MHRCLPAALCVHACRRIASTVACRLVYGLPGAPTPVALTAISGIIELAFLLAAALISARPGKERPQEQAAEAAAAAAPGIAADGLTAQPAEAAVPEQGGRPAALGLLLGLPAAALAGLEIGCVATARWQDCCRGQACCWGCCWGSGRPAAGGCQWRRWWGLKQGGWVRGCLPGAFADLSLPAPARSKPGIQPWLLLPRVYGPWRDDT